MGLAVFRPSRVKVLNAANCDCFCMKIRNHHFRIRNPSLLKYSTQPSGPSRHPAISYRPYSFCLPSATLYLVCNTPRYCLTFWQLAATCTYTFSTPLPPSLPPSFLSRYRPMNTKESIKNKRRTLWTIFRDSPYEK